MIQLPPMPQLEEFMLDGALHRPHYTEALAAWERVCSKIIAELLEDYL